MSAPSTLAEVRAVYPPAGDVFPKHVLKGCETALVMFAAGFYGVQDAYWIAKAGLRATCVDIDAEKLAVMENVYPDDWRFVKGDVFSYMAASGAEWDVVIADAPTELSDRCVRQLPLLLPAARRACVISVHAEMALWDEILHERLLVPEPWERTGTIYRTSNYGGCYWLILERQA